MALKSYKIFLHCFTPSAKNSNSKTIDDQPLNPKQKKIMEIICSLQPQYTADIGGNGSQYGAILAANAIKFISIDTNLDSLDKSYIAFIKNNKTSGEYFYVAAADFIKPPLASHLGPIDSSGNIIPFCPAFKDRLPVIDLALMLNMVHNLCFIHNLIFSDIVKQATIFTKNYLLIEFLTCKHRQIKKWLKDPKLTHKSWYNTANFISALQDHFEILNEYDLESTHENIQKGESLLFLCKIKQTN